MALSPNTENFTLGKGVVYFNRKNLTTNAYEGERDLGNAPAFSYTMSLEKLEHYSSRGGLKAKDKEIISQVTPTIAFTLDEVTAENLALLTLANITTVAQAAATVTTEEHVAHHGRRVALLNRAVSEVVVTNVTTSANTPVVDVDYAVDTSLKDDAIGRVYIIPGSTQISEGDTINVAYTADEVDYQKIGAFGQTQVEGFLRFVSDNPAGDDQELQIWRVSLSPTGDTAMIGDDWSTLGFTGEVLKDATGHPDSPYFDIIFGSTAPTPVTP